jgi:hypothetical protein
MSRHDHVIAQCHWQTGFDEVQEASALQNAISQWSQQVLPNILNACFDQHCPTAQIWRITRMELDLGTISLSELDRELPLRLKAAVEEALMRLFRQYSVLPFSVGKGDFQIIDRHLSALDQIRWFLCHGTSPWWENSSRSPLFLVDQQFEDQPQQLAELLRQLGHSEVVRRRIVWQWGEPRVQRTIHLLEPWHADFIHRYADNLAHSQQQKPFVNTHHRELKTNIWYWILTHLLVERGTLFNTLQFVRSTLYQMAQHYQMDFSDLLQNLCEVARQMQAVGVMGPQFLQVLLLLDTTEQTPAALPTVEPELNLWQLLQRMLHRRDTRYLQNFHPVYLNELFVRLASVDSARTARILREEGKAESVRQLLLQHFDQAQLQTLVAVIAPEDQLFILTHVSHTQVMLREQRLDPQMIWRILLDYLLANSGSHFNRRQLVQATLTELSREFQLDYSLLLALLIRTSVQWQLTPHHFELLAILQELQSVALNSHEESRFLQLQYEVGHHVSAEPIRVLAAILRLRPELRHQSFLLLFRQQEWQRMSPDKLSRYFTEKLAANNQLNLSELCALLMAISPTDGQSASRLLLLVFRWQAQGRFPKLPVSDPVQWFNRVLIEALLSRVAVSGHTMHWQERLVAILQRESGLDSAYWEALLCLNSASASPSSTDVFSIAQFSSSPSSDGVLSALLRQLPSMEKAQQMQTALLAVIEHPEAARLLMHLSQKPQGQKWLAPFLPVTLQQDSVRRQLWQSLADCVGEISTESKSALVLHLQQNFWQVWAKEIHAYWLVHHRLIGFSIALPQLIANLLRHWAGQNRVRLSALEEQIQQQRQETALSYVDWSLVLQQFTTVGSRSSGFDASPDFKATVKKNTSVGARSMDTMTEDSAVQSFLFEKQNWYQDSAGHYLAQPVWRAWLCQWLKTGQQPKQIAGIPQVDWRQGLMDWLCFYPEQFRRQIGQLAEIPAVHFRLANYLTLPALLDAMAHHPQSLQAEIQTIQILHKLVLQLNLSQMTTAEREQLLLICVLQAWLRQDWSQLTPEALVSSLFWQILQFGSVSSVHLIKQLTQPGLAAGYVLRQAVDTFVAMLRKRAVSSPSVQKRTTVQPVIQDPSAFERESTFGMENPENSQATPWPPVHDRYDESIDSVPLQTLPMAVLNAGLVLVQSFIPALFERLQLVQDNQFISSDMQRRAVHCLQVLATGATETEEYFLLLNKVLCGLPLSHPVESGIHLSTEESDIIHSLIEAVINYWPAIGKTSIDGFRGNWLVRNGTLTESQDHWDLIVEKRPYDVLIARAPLSYSIIRLPWMKKPIYVTWPT